MVVTDSSIFLPFRARKCFFYNFIYLFFPTRLSSDLVNCLKRKGGKGEADILHVPFCVFLAIIWKEEDWSCVGCIPKLSRTELHSCLRHHSELLRFCPHSLMIDTSSVKGSVVWWPCLWSGRPRSPTGVDRNGNSSIFCLPSGENKAICGWCRQCELRRAVSWNCCRLPRGWWGSHPLSPPTLSPAETELFVCLLSAHLQFLLAFWCAAFCFHQLAQIFFFYFLDGHGLHQHLKFFPPKNMGGEKKEKENPPRRKPTTGGGWG